MARHDLDVLALVAGLVTVAAAVLYLLDGGGVVDVTVRWTAPVALLALGIGGLATALRVRSDPDDPAGDPPSS